MMTIAVMIIVITVTSTVSELTLFQSLADRMRSRFLRRWISGGASGTPAVAKNKIKSLHSGGTFWSLAENHFRDLPPDRWTDTFIPPLEEMCELMKTSQNSDSGLLGAAHTGEEGRAAR